MQSYFNDELYNKVMGETRKSSKTRSVSTQITNTISEYLTKSFDFFSNEGSFTSMLGEKLYGIIGSVDVDGEVEITGHDFHNVESDEILNVRSILNWLEGNSTTISFPIDDVNYGIASMKLVYDANGDNQYWYLPNSEGTLSWDHIFAYSTNSDNLYISDSVATYEKVNGEFVSVDTTSAFSEVFSRATLLNVFSYVSSLAANALSNNSTVSGSDVSAYVNNLTRNKPYATNIGNTMDELLETIAAGSDPSSLVKYMKEVMNASVPIASNGVFTLTDNSQLVTKHVGAVASSLTSAVVSSIVTVVGVAIGGIWGAAVAVAGMVFNAVVNSINAMADSSSYVRFSGSQECTYPYGLYQIQLGSSDSKVIQAQNTGASIAYSPFGYLLCSSDKSSEFHIQEFSTDYSTFKSLWTTDGSGVTTFNFTRGEVWDKACIAKKSYSPVRLLSQDAAIIDKYERAEYIMALLWWYAFLLSGSRNGYTESLSPSQDGIRGALGSLYQMFSSYSTFDQFANAIDSDGSWIAISSSTGGSGTLGVALNMINTRTMNKYWYQYNDKFYNDTISLTALYTYGIEWFGVPSISEGNGLVSIYFVPNIDIVPPAFDRGSLVSGIVGTIAQILIVATVAFITYTATRRAIQTFNLKQSAKVERAYNDVVSNPTTANALKYNKTVRKHNLLARMTGGTIYDASNYWSGGSQNPTPISTHSIDDILKLIRG